MDIEAFVKQYENTVMWGKEKLSSYPMIAVVSQYDSSPSAMQMSPTMRSWPSLNCATLVTVSRHAFGARNGISPSTTSTKQSAASMSMKRSSTRDYLPRPPLCFKNLKKSALGSSTMTSLLFLNDCLYASSER